MFVEGFAFLYGEVEHVIVLSWLVFEIYSVSACPVWLEGLQASARRGQAGKSQSLRVLSLGIHN